MAVSITFRTTDGTRWGVGSGADAGGLLSPTQVDMNFWNLKQAVETLEGLLPDAARGIIDFTIAGDQLYVNMSDATQEGPYTLPTITLTGRGIWQPSTVYNIGDLVINGTAVYVVPFAHTSQTGFDPAANDGLGNDYYTLFLDLTGLTIPPGGTPGQVLGKVSGTDYDVAWTTQNPVQTPGHYLASGVGVAVSVFGSFTPHAEITDRIDEVIYYPASGLPQDVTSEWEITAQDTFDNTTFGFTDTTGGALLFRWTHFS